MGTTNPASSQSRGDQNWSGGLLPFFNHFIREGGLTEWVRSLVGTSEVRDLHPHKWTYDDKEERVERDDVWVNKDGDVEEESLSFTVNEVLSELLAREVDRALVKVRAEYSSSIDPDRLLQAYFSEANSLWEVAAKDSTLSTRPQVGAQLLRLEKEINQLSGGRLRRRTSSKGKGKHSQNESWVALEYVKVTNDQPGLSEIAARNLVADRYSEEFGYSIDERTIRRYTIEKG